MNDILTSSHMSVIMDRIGEGFWKERMVVDLKTVIKIIF